MKTKFSTGNAGFITGHVSPEPRIDWRLVGTVAGEYAALITMFIAGYALYVVMP
jgi:hypothetical protein